MRPRGAKEEAKGRHVSEAGQAKATAQVPDEREMKGNHRTWCGTIISNIHGANMNAVFSKGGNIMLGSWKEEKPMGLEIEIVRWRQRVEIAKEGGW